MATTFPHELLEDARELSTYEGWTEGVYRDFLALRRGDLSEAAFNDKYRQRCAILSLDMTGFVSSAIQFGELTSLLRILDAQRVCIPVLKEFGAEIIRCFADDMVAIFSAADAAVDAAFELHRRVARFSESDLSLEHPTQCCVGIGYGEVFAIGPNLAQGDEMNRASKLGEDIARANETLLTERAFQALQGRRDIFFDRQNSDDLLFPYYSAVPSTR
jgi:adenylate cyclase